MATDNKAAVAAGVLGGVVAGAGLAMMCGDGARIVPAAPDTPVAPAVPLKGMAGKVALVTGAAGAIGAAVSRTLHSAGVDVALLDITDEGLAKMTAELSSCPGGRVLPLKVDISDHAAIEDAVAKVNEQLGAPSILVNVAGILSNNKLAETSVAEWDRVMNINVTAAFLLCKACCPAMAAQGWGRVVNISSWAWKSGGLTAVRARLRPSLLSLPKSPLSTCPWPLAPPPRDAPDVFTGTCAGHGILGEQGCHDFIDVFRRATVL